MEEINKLNKEIIDCLEKVIELERKKKVAENILSERKLQQEIEKRKATEAENQKLKDRIKELEAIINNQLTNQIETQPK